MKNAPPLRRWLRRVVIACVALTAAVFTAYWFENWRGFHRLAQIRAELASHGEAAPARSVPKPVPSEENFGALSCWGERREVIAKNMAAIEQTLRKTNGLSASDGPFVEVLRLLPENAPAEAIAAKIGSGSGSAAERLAATLAALDPLTREMRDAARRPSSFFLHSGAEAEKAPQPEASLTMTHLLEVDGIAALAAGDGDRVHVDLLAMSRICRAVAAEPNLSWMVLHMALVQKVVILGQAGSQRLPWTAGQRSELRRALGEIALRQGLIAALRDDRARTESMAQTWIDHPDRKDGATPPLPAAFQEHPHLPRGWLAGSLARSLMRYEQAIAALAKAPAGADPVADAGKICAQPASLDDAPWNAVERSAFSPIAGIFPAVHDLQEAVDALAGSLEKSGSSAVIR